MYHGLRLSTPKNAVLHFGIEQLIGRCQSWLLPVDENTPIALKQAVSRFHNQNYWQCAKKCKQTVHNMNMAAKHIGRYMYYVENEDEYVFDGAPMESVAPYYQTMQEAPYHLDAFMIHIRILADCLAYAVPFFYTERKQDIAWRSFRDHRKWFIDKERGYDPAYCQLLEEKTDWFEVLAGKNPKGIRDEAIHAPFFATNQFGAQLDATGKRQVVVQMVDSKGFVNSDLTFTLSEMVADLFQFLDGVFTLFANRLINELSPLLDSSLDDLSLFMTIKDDSALQEKYRIYPMIQV